jgi:hypothetical protein
VALVHSTVFGALPQALNNGDNWCFSAEKVTSAQFERLITTKLAPESEKPATRPPLDSSQT